MRIRLNHLLHLSNRATQARPRQWLRTRLHFESGYGGSPFSIWSCIETIDEFEQTSVRVRHCLFASLLLAE
ncbi:hypothetical protein LILAB_34255 [Corallococcus macrosporus]|uniref:Uncharacterized protein n=1 Tax=Myxococcus fulvus (strain ATCC BAA-855 / HW-1) TaxID=483219 RepID=F8CGJ7_MYXFH|nr:hypothetical protein LILAB_34255 [Corallococcus macrosporus]